MDRTDNSSKQGFRQGDLVVAPIQYTDFRGMKFRLSIVISNNFYLSNLRNHTLQCVVITVDPKNKACNNPHLLPEGYTLGARCGGHCFFDNKRNHDYLLVPLTSETRDIYSILISQDDLSYGDYTGVSCLRFDKIQVTNKKVIRDYIGTLKVQVMQKIINDVRGLF